MQRVTLLSFLSTTTLLRHAQAYNNGRNIATCGDFECPGINGTSAQAECRVDSITYTDLGMRNVTTPLGKFSWTMGQRYFSDAADGLREGADTCTTSISREIFLGVESPKDLDSETLTGCAFFLNGSMAAFQGPSDTSTCDEVLPKGCADALIEYTGTTVSTLLREPDETDEQHCAAIAHFLQRAARLPDACALLASGSGWPTISSRALSSALKPVDRSSSNCNPTLPSTNELLPVLSYNQSVDGGCIDTSQSINVSPPYNKQLYQALPILTSFAPFNGTANVNLTCLRAVRPFELANAAPPTSPSLLLAILLGFMCVCSII